MKIQIKILNKEFYKTYLADGAVSDRGHSLPSYATPGSAAVDLVCTKDITIYPGERVMIPTGLAVWIGSGAKTTMINPSGYEIMPVAGFIIPRSGLGTKGLILANTVGLIDEDYTGELKISAWNSNNAIEYTDSGYPLDKEIKKRHSDRPDEYYKVIELKAGDRIAQMYFAPVIKVQWEVVGEFTQSTERGEGGFNSTGA